LHPHKLPVDGVRAGSEHPELRIVAGRAITRDALDDAHLSDLRAGRESGGRLATPEHGVVEMANESCSEPALRVAGCPDCGAPAEVIDEGVVASTDGLITLVRTLCARRHWFLLPADRVASVVP
jgi:hypothetical protein